MFFAAGRQAPDFRLRRPLDAYDPVEKTLDQEVLAAL